MVDYTEVLQIYLAAIKTAGTTIKRRAKRESKHQQVIYVDSTSLVEARPN